MLVKTLKSRSLLRNEQGNMLALVAAGFPLLIFSAGLAVDTSTWVQSKSKLQQVADAAAMAGVYGVIQGDEPEAAADKSIASNKDLDARRAVQVERSPIGHSQDPYAVLVRVSAPAKLSFSSLFLKNSPTITAEATATVVENGEFCAFAIGSAKETGVQIEPGSRLELECGIATNASSAKAIVADASSSLDATAIVAFGKMELGGATTSARTRSYGLRQKDALADTEPPLVPNTGCPNITVNPDARGRVVLQPGCYGNLTLNGPVSMEAGEYILNRGNLSVGPTGEVTCKKCTIFLTSQDAATDPGSIGKVKIHPHAKVKMSAPKDGPNAGILMYQDRHAAGNGDGLESIIGGNGFSQLEGLLYFPSDTLRIDASRGPDLRCARFLGRRLILQGQVFVAKDCANSGVVNFAGTEVRLVS